MIPGYWWIEKIVTLYCFQTPLRQEVCLMTWLLALQRVNQIGEAMKEKKIKPIQMLKKSLL